ncbi:hypothetical protein SMICM304S_10849 [Streptomyces microflavus]
MGADPSREQRPRRAPTAISGYLVAHTARDTAAALATLAADAAVTDEGKTYRGHAEYRSGGSRAPRASTRTRPNFSGAADRRGPLDRHAAARRRLPGRSCRPAFPVRPRRSRPHRAAGDRGSSLRVPGRCTFIEGEPSRGLSYDGEPGRSIESHRGLVRGRGHDGNRTRAPAGQGRTRAQHGIAPVAVPAMVRMGADRFEQPAPAFAGEPSGRGGRGFPGGRTDECFAGQPGRR